MARPAVILPTLLLGVVIALAALDVTPITIWLYPLAWLPLLALLDGLAAVRDRNSLLHKPRELAIMLFWSAVIWFGFEALNLRLANWYYVYVPADRLQRWAGAAVAFTTVIPAILLPMRLLEQRRFAASLTTRPINVGPYDLHFAFGLGAALLVAVLALPRLLYPLAWGALWLMAEPLLYHQDPAHSLFRDIEAGRFSRLARLMAGGLVAGALWESLNALARTRWIYTVPLLERLKLFEMPPLGFLGFPFFALEAWSLYYLLRRWTRWWTVVPATLGALVVLAGMDQRTFASTLPWVSQLPEIPTDVVRRLERDGLGDAFRIVRAGPTTLIRDSLSPDEASRLYALAQLAALRGIGTRNAAALAAAGYGSVTELSTAEPDAVWRAVRRPDAPRPSAAEVRVWVRAAKQATAL
jgi:hypothetical protein